MRWAIINTDTNTVENIIIWDGLGQLYPYQTNQLVSLTEDEWCEAGASYNHTSTPRFTSGSAVAEEP